MNNNDERDFAEESYNAAEYRREYEAELLDEKAQIRTVVHLSDTSHPFTSYEHNPRILHFSDDERKALESLEGEKSDNSLREELFREESDKRVLRYFIGQSGWVWFVHYIFDIPEKYDATLPNMSKALYRAKDGMTTLHMTSLFMSKEKAWDSVYEDIRLNTEYSDDFLTHVVELDTM